MNDEIITTNLYNNLTLHQIDSKKKIQIISNTFDIDRSTIFRWIKKTKFNQDVYNNNISSLNKYLNKNITLSVETLIIKNINKYKSINKLKKFINKTLNTSINNNIIKCVLACNNLKIKNFNNIDVNELTKINCSKHEPKIIIDKEVENFIVNNKHNSVKTIIDDIKLEFNIIFHKTDIIGIFQKHKIDKKSFYKITPFVNDYIINKIKNNPILTAKNIIDDLYTDNKIRISTTSIYNIYKKNNLTYKKVKFNNNPNPISIQKERVMEVKKSIESIDLDNAVSYDEISIVLNSKPDYGWSEKNTECIINIDNSKIYRERFTIGVATSNKKIIDYCVVPKGLKSNDYVNFMDKMYKNIEDKENKTFFIDNASIHQSKMAKKLYKKNKMHIIFNAPYHSEFNPIEYVFSMLRNEINRNPNDTIEKIEETIKNFIKNVKKETLENIFNNCIEKINNFIK